MDRHNFESILTLAAILIFFLGFGLALLISPWLDQKTVIVIVAIGVPLLLVVGFGFNRFIQAYIFETKRLAEEILLIAAANPSHRVQAKGPDEIRHLTGAINTFADRFQRQLEQEGAQIQQARASLEEEKNRLAALMSELSEGVLVCNSEGQILLYNHRAKQLLGRFSNSGPSSQIGGFVGLGRSVFGLIDRQAITHALQTLAYRLEKESAPLFSQFVTTATNGQLIRARVAPVLTHHQEINGFVLTLEDITRQSQISSRRDTLLQMLIEGVRASLANIRAAIETIEQYPEMDSQKLGQLKKIIYDESLTLSTRLNQTTTEHAADLKANWQLEEILGNDLLWAIQRRFEDKLAVSTTIEDSEENLWLKVDSYLVVQAVSYMMGRLKQDFGIHQVNLRVKKKGQLAAFDLVWPNGLTNMETLWLWQNEPMNINSDGPPLTLSEVVERHGGEVWCQTDKSANLTYFRLLLPTTQPTHSLRPTHVAQASRPEYYDFDLFHQPGQTPELDKRLLTELTYTVLDTETTGLDPAAGDEIISMSAVRIVNGRLLRQEIFDQLIDPKRPLPKASTQITGILPEMVKGQPTIEQALPVFYKFAEGTVLVGHNAAFDMRLLQLKETKTGVKFTNPVLDTLLLSAVAYPQQEDHSLESIAARLGIDIIGRHTSLGDAIVTGEIFLRLIPGLTEKGLVTLADVRKAAEETYYARLKY